jgi:carboxyl-terminal processing protease
MRRAACIGIGVLLVAGGAFGWVSAHRDPVLAVAAPVVPATVPLVFPHDPIFGTVPPPKRSPSVEPPRPLEEAREAIATLYYRHVSPELLARATIPEILGGLDDPFTQYLSPGELGSLEAALTSRYFGVGLTVSPAEEGLLVTGSLRGPAHHAGIKPGDVIVRVDGERAARLGFEHAISLIPGEAGTVVRLTVRRPGERNPIDFAVTRGEFQVDVVSARMLDPEGDAIGVIRLTSFSEEATGRVREEAERLLAAGAKGLVLDLRGNPGGLLTEAVRVASLFVANGIICSTESVNQASRVFRVTGFPIETAIPVAVLVDGGTASAAEIVAVALRDNGRATIVGARTYGKTTVQTLLTLSNGSALRLTTATYLTPNGRTIRETGLKPKIVAVDDPATRADEALRAARAFLVEHD